MPKRLTQEEILERFRAQHGNKYDYSLFVYCGIEQKSKIICPTHGVFEKSPTSHISGQGCRECTRENFSKNSFLPREDVLDKFKSVHGDLYNYELVKYVNNSMKVQIICKKHGIFEQRPRAHFAGGGCPLCANESRGNKLKHSVEKVIEKFQKVHGTKYDYSLMSYQGNKHKIKIICPIHGEFEKSPGHHINGQGCPKCGWAITSQKMRLSQEEIIQKFTETHQNKYCYDLVEYIGTEKEVKIICPIHGVFEQLPVVHVGGSGCRICGYKKVSDSRVFSREEFIEKANFKHQNKYNYDFVNYVNSQTKVIIICSKHGEFLQKPNNHILGQGCILCRDEDLSLQRKMSDDEIIERFRKTHGNKYSYELMEYVNTKAKIKILCKEHGEFLQTPQNHFLGQNCPLCSSCFSRGEIKITNFLKSNNIEYVPQKMIYINNERHYFDFYIPSINTYLEYDGELHFKIVPFFGGEKTLKKQQQRDKTKDDYCLSNEIPLLRIPYTEFDNIEQILESVL